MRLPRDDRDGELPRESVISTLREHGVVKADLPGNGVLLGRDDDFLEVQYFPPMISRFQISALARKFEIHPLVFYGYPPPNDARAPN